MYKFEPQPSPYIVFHYSVICKESSFLGFNFLELRKSFPASFVDAMRKSWEWTANLAIAVPIKLERQLEEKIEKLPVTHLFPYGKEEDLPFVLNDSGLPIALYYDLDKKRGQSVGVAIWREP